jgi:hypothetical protein
LERAGFHAGRNARITIGRPIAFAKADGSGLIERTIVLVAAAAHAATIIRR